MKRNRGFTLIELVIASAITTITVGSMAMVYHFAAIRTSSAFATGTVTSQVQTLASEIDKTIMDSSGSAVVTAFGNTGLKCTLPQTEVDTDADGKKDTYQPATLNAGAPTWGKGKRVWFYMANATGNFSAPGTILWKAERNDDLYPTGADADKTFTFNGGAGTQRFSLVDQVSFSTSSADKTATYTVRASALMRADRSSATAYTTEKNMAQTVTVSKTVFMENFRQ